MEKWNGLLAARRCRNKLLFLALRWLIITDSQDVDEVEKMREYLRGEMLDEMPTR